MHADGAYERLAQLRYRLRRTGQRQAKMSRTTTNPIGGTPGTRRVNWTRDD